MWLLEQSIKRAIESAEAQGFTPTADQVSTFEARAEDIMAIDGPKAQIKVAGVLTATRSWMAYFFGGGNTTYADIQAALAAADADSNVETISMFIDSPGGAVHGLFECIAAVQNTAKPIEVTSSRACSAAYALAAAAGPIRATSAGSTFGSIGVVVDAFVDKSRVSVTSTLAPKKRPDLTTEEGLATIREELDALHDLFVETIANGRGVGADNINADFGEGATLLADEALKRGMIDSITTEKPATANSNGGNQQEARSMDLQTLKAQNPDVYAAAAQEGRDQERDRVTAHLTMGEASGDMKTAIDAINDGSEMTATLQAKYLAAGMNRSDAQARQDDDADAAAADSANASDADAEAAAAVNILAQAAEQCGVELEG